MKQPYIYTLPESFLEDKSVPMRWKLYSLINGFWIGGLEVFASNKFFAEKLNCTERHVQGCLEDLENLGVVRREVHGMDRKIYPGTNPAFVGGRTGSSQRHEPSVRHNSDSNSVSINRASPVEIIEEVSEKKPKTPNKYPNALSVFELWGETYPRNWKLNTTQLRAAENLFAEQGIVKITSALRWYNKNKDEDFAPAISSPYDLDSKWLKLEAFYDRQHA